MTIVTRRARLDDVAAITEVHCSNVREWLRFPPKGKPVPACREELSLYQLCRNGGPWMSVETCAIHLNRLLLAGHYPLVAELDGQVLGEAELFLSEEPPPLGRYLSLSVLYVHRAHHGRGLGSALMRAALDLAAELECDALTVYPEASAFYARFGLKPFVTCMEVTVLCQPERMTYRSEALEYGDYKLVAGLAMPIGRYVSACQEWERERPLNQWAFEEEKGIQRVPLRLEVDSQVLYVVFTGECRRATVRAWTMGDLSERAIQALQDQGHRLGFERLELFMEEGEARRLLGEKAVRESSSRMEMWLKRVKS